MVERPRQSSYQVNKQIKLVICHEVWIINPKHDKQITFCLSKGGRGVPRFHIIENELECLGDRKGHDSHLAEKFWKKYYS